MEALEFLKERKRMCYSYEGCNGCPFREDVCSISNAMSEDGYKKIVSTVEKWSKEHPHKTRQSVFLEKYPEAELTKDCVISICPIAVSAAYRNKIGGCASPTRPRCSECRRVFWMQEVE